MFHYVFINVSNLFYLTKKVVYRLIIRIKLKKQTRDKNIVFTSTGFSTELRYFLS